MNIAKTADRIGLSAWTISPENRLVAIAYRSTGYIFPREDNSKPIARLLGHTNFIRGIHFSADGSRIVTFGDDKTMRLWSQNGDQIIALPNSVAPDDGSNNEIISPGRKWVVTVADDGIARIWSADNGMPINTMPAAKVATAALSPDSGRLVTISHDNEVVVWNSKTGDRVARLASDEKDEITQATFSSDAKRIVTVGGSSSDNVSIWDVSTGNRIIRLKTEDVTVVKRAMFAPDERYVYGWERATEARPPTVRVWSAQTGEILASVSNGEYVKSATISADSKVLLTAQLSDLARARIFPDPDQIATRAAALVRRLTPLAQPRACNIIIGVCEER
jgi:WD40 repeat protein